MVDLAGVEPKLNVGAVVEVVLVEPKPAPGIMLLKRFDVADVAGCFAGEKVAGGLGLGTAPKMFDVVVAGFC